MLLLQMITIVVVTIAGEVRLSIINLQHHHSCHLANVCIPGWTAKG